MPHVTKSKELWVITPNDIGALSTVSKTVSAAGVNFVTMSAWGEKKKGYFRMLTSNNAKAAEALKKLKYKISETDVLLVNIGNKPGTLAPIAKKIGDEGIQIEYCYATAWGDKTILVIATKDNAKAYRILSQG